MSSEKEKNGKCRHPEKLKGRPGECSPEQVRECHGEGPGHPCADNTPECRHPEKLKVRPGECSPEQVRECHGAEPGHSCGQ